MKNSKNQQAHDDEISISSPYGQEQISSAGGNERHAMLLFDVM